VVEHFQKSNAVKVFVGGAPVTQAYADHIGADGYAKDARAAVRLISEKFGVAA
jgi:5-methyltetrahydrofolate--homocysteine methyltransferase